MRKIFIIFLPLFFFLCCTFPSFAAEPSVSLVRVDQNNRGIFNISEFSRTGPNWTSPTTVYYQGSYSYQYIIHLRSTEDGLYNLDGTNLSFQVGLVQHDGVTAYPWGVTFGLPQVDVSYIPDGLNYDLYLSHTDGSGTPVAPSYLYGIQSYGSALGGGKVYYIQPDYKTNVNLTVSNSTYITSGGAGISIIIDVTYPVYYYYQASTATSAFTPNVINSYATFSAIPREGVYNVSSSLVSSSSNPVVDEMRKEHQEEINSANNASSSATSGVTQVTGVLSSWEIFTMPFTLLKDLYNGLTGDGSTTITFPSYSIMGYQIWDSYSFDLTYISTNFPIITDSLHILTGILVVGWFVHYLHRKWATIVGDDLPDDE